MEEEKKDDTFDNLDEVSKSEEIIEESGAKKISLKEALSAGEEDVSLTSKKYVSKRELWMFGLAAGGQGMIYAIMSSYISEFYLNVAMLPPMFVFWLMLIARIFDAAYDPVIGTIMDRTELKHGKYKSYVLYTSVPIAILTFLMFYIPSGISQKSLMAYAAVTYILWGMIYSISDVPFWCLPNVITPNASERGQVISFSRMINGVGSAVPMAMYMILSFILPLMTHKTGTELDKIQYMTIALFCAIVGGVIFITSHFTTKERVVVPKTPKRKEKSEEGALMRVLKCKPLMIIVAMGILASGRYLVQVAAIHVARYSFYVGPSLEGLDAEAIDAALRASRGLVSTVFMICSAAGMFGAMLFLPALYKKFNYKQIVIVSCLAGFASSILMTVLGWFVSFWACLPFIVISSIPLGVINVTSYAMIGDALDYMEWETGKRETALGSSTQTFVNQFSNAIATSLIVLVYLALKIDPAGIVEASGVFNPLEMPTKVRFGMFSLVSILPGVSMLLCTIPVFFYDLVGKKKNKILKELEEQRAERGMAIGE
ncbi:MAG: MFS transporter [Clostridiales bacterium]|jgi:Na+/melibiose symporter-like transporter|nr:MFS transporter [Clostridiales bacterium]